MQGWDEDWGLRDEAEWRLEMLGVVRRERVLRVRAAGMLVEEEQEATDCSSSLFEADEEAVDGLGERGYLRREMGCERVRLKSGREGVRGVEG